MPRHGLAFPRQSSGLIHGAARGVRNAFKSRAELQREADRRRVDVCIEELLSVVDSPPPRLRKPQTDAVRARVPLLRISPSSPVVVSSRARALTTSPRRGSTKCCKCCKCSLRAESFLAAGVSKVDWSATTR